MLPQIKLIQAVDRLFPKQSGQQKYGSSKKKKKKERARRGPLSGSEAFKLEGHDPGTVRVCMGFSPFQAREAPLFRHQDPWMI